MKILARFNCSFDEDYIVAFAVELAELVAPVAFVIAV